MLGRPANQAGTAMQKQVKKGIHDPRRELRVSTGLWAMQMMENDYSVDQVASMLGCDREVLAHLVMVAVQETGRDQTSLSRT